MQQQATFRFYEELNDFLPAEQRKRDIPYRFEGSPAIKDPIEALGVPHPEVELILVNGTSVDFRYRLRNGDRVSVYPMFEALDVSPLLRLREQPLREPRFVVDVNLGKLARRLRLLGFDTSYRNDYHDAEIVAEAVAEHRIILTRDRRLLHHRQVSHGYWVRAVQPELQLEEVLARLDLYRLARPFRRCIACNGEVAAVAKADIESQLEPLTRRYYQEFYQCGSCGRIYWKGSHYRRILEYLARLQTTAAS